MNRIGLSPPTILTSSARVYTVVSIFWLLTAMLITPAHAKQSLAEITAAAPTLGKNTAAIETVVVTQVTMAAFNVEASQRAKQNERALFTASEQETPETTNLTAQIIGINTDQSEWFSTERITSPPSSADQTQATLKELVLKQDLSQTAALNALIAKRLYGQANRQKRIPDNLSYDGYLSLTGGRLKQDNRSLLARTAAFLRSPIKHLLINLDTDLSDRNASAHVLLYRNENSLKFGLGMQVELLPGQLEPAYFYSAMLNYHFNP